MKKLNTSLFYAFVICYALSLCLPAIVQHSNTSGAQTVYGYDVLTFGIIGDIPNAIAYPSELIFFAFYLAAGLVIALLSFGTFAWYGNVFALFAVIAAKKWPGLAAIFAFIGMMVGFLAFTYHTITIPDNTVVVVDHLAIGYYVWEFSLFILTAYCLSRFFQSHNKVGI